VDAQLRSAKNETLMPKSLGAHSPVLKEARELASAKGRRRQHRFLFEGPTLLSEAKESGLSIRSIFVTAAAYDATPLIGEIERHGTIVWVVTAPVMQRLSDVTTPSGIVAVADQRLHEAAAILARPGPALVLAGLNDPGNAGTIIRSAEAFGAAGVFFGEGSVEPYHPKVVRSAMGALFRLPVARISVEELKRLPSTAHRAVLGLDAGAEDDVSALPRQSVIVVGQERAGLGAWAEACSGTRKIGMRAGESLNAAVAASIALYEASKPKPPP
jgi:RNA methyltransferase, TrmH family